MTFEDIKTAHVSRWLQELSESGMDEAEAVKIDEVITIINQYQD
jgi:hypothetical protein